MSPKIKPLAKLQPRFEGRCKVEQRARGLGAQEKFLEGFCLEVFLFGVGDHTQ